MVLKTYELLVLSEVVQEVEPVQRAYIRIELDEALAGRGESPLPAYISITVRSDRRKHRVLSAP